MTMHIPSSSSVVSDGTLSSPIQGNHSHFSKAHLGHMANPQPAFPVCSEAAHH